MDFLSFFTRPPVCFLFSCRPISCLSNCAKSLSAAAAAACTSCRNSEFNLTGHCTKIRPRKPFLVLRSVFLAILNARYHPCAVPSLFPTPSSVWPVVWRSDETTLREQDHIHTICVLNLFSISKNFHKYH